MRRRLLEKWEVLKSEIFTTTTNIFKKPSRAIFSVTGFYMHTLMGVLVSTSFIMFTCKPCRGKATNNNHIVFIETIVPKVSEIFLECLSSLFSKYSLPLKVTMAKNYLGLQLY